MQTAKVRKIQSIKIKDPIQIRLKTSVNKFKYIHTGISQPKKQTSISRFRDSSIKNNSRMQTANTSMVSKAKNSLQSTTNKSVMNKTINSRKKLSQDFTPLPSTPRNVSIYETKKLRESRLRSVKVQRRKQFTEKLDEQNKKLFKIIYIQRYWRMYYYTKLDNGALMIQKIYFGYLFRKCFIYVKTFNLQLNILLDTMNKSIVKSAFEKLVNQIKLLGPPSPIKKEGDKRASNDKDKQDFSWRAKQNIPKPLKNSNTIKKDKGTELSQNNVTHNLSHSNTNINTKMNNDKIDMTMQLGTEMELQIKTKDYIYTEVPKEKINIVISKSIPFKTQSQNTTILTKSHYNQHELHHPLSHIILIQKRYKKHLAIREKSKKTKDKINSKQPEIFKVKLFTFYMNNQLYQGILKYAFNQIKQAKKHKNIVIKLLNFDASRNLNNSKHLTSNISVNNELESADYKRLKNINGQQRNMHFPTNEKEKAESETITENSFDDDWEEIVTLRKNIPYSFVPFSYHQNISNKAIP